MDLNQAITLDQFKQLGHLIKSNRSLMISVSSTILSLFLLFNCYDIYADYELYEQKNADFLDLSNQVAGVEKKSAKLLKDNKDYLDRLNASPKTQSEMADLLTNLAGSSNLIVKKMTANEDAKSQEKAGLIDLELEGNYPSISNFITKAKLALVASKIQMLKLEKRKESQYIHLSMSIKFSPPPVLNKEKLSVVFNMNGQDYYYDNFDRWQMKKAGFVQVPDPSSPQNTVNQQRDKDSSNGSEAEEVQKRQDPFQPSTKANGLDGSSVNKKSSDSSSSIFLSGILYSASKAVCIITMPSGESKVFESGEVVDRKRKVKLVKQDDVSIITSVEREYKVGQEIYAK